MSALWSPYAFDVGGQPYALSAPPALRAIGGQLTAVQAAMAQDAFARFCNAQRYSLVPNPSEISRLPDGTAYRIDVVGVQAIMQVWPAVQQADDVRGVVYLGDFVYVTKFTFVRKGGVVSYEVDDEAGWDGRRRYSFGGRGFPANITDLSRTGVFQDNNYLFAGDGGIVSNKALVKPLYGSALAYPRRYSGIGYVAFQISREEITQDDGTLVCSAETDTLLTNVAFHPKDARVILDVLPAGDPSGSIGFTARGNVILSPFRGPDAVATHIPTLSLVRLPTYSVTKKEISLQQNGQWGESRSEVVPPSVPASAAPARLDFEYTDYYLGRIGRVKGAVNYTIDQPFTSFRATGELETGGTCFLEASYNLSIPGDNSVRTFDSAGREVNVKYGMQRSAEFSASARVSHSELFDAYEKTHHCDAINREWYEFEGERLYTIDARVKWGATSISAPAISSTGGTLAGYGAYEGSATLQVECQRRQVLRYDPEMQFLCYVEEQAFEYLWEPFASCAFMSGYGEYATPYPGIPLEGNGVLVPVGEPVLDLVMKLRGVEVMRERLHITDAYLIRAGMIPMTSANLLPQADALPQGFVSMEEYQRRMRVLLCTAYQCEVLQRRMSQTPAGTTNENYVRMVPSVPLEGAPPTQLDDYFLRLGSFMEFDLLRSSYVNDPVTKSGVLAIWASDSFLAYEQAAYVITESGVTKRPMVAGQDRTLYAA